MTKPTYIGFSSSQFETNKTFVMTNQDIVNRDLWNHIHTKRGERVDLNNFGTDIPDLLMEPLDSNTIEAIEEQLTAVFDYDPRVQMMELSVIPDYETHSIYASAILNYIELNLTDRFDIHLKFEI